MRGNADITHAIETHSDTVLRVCTLYFHSRPEREDAFQETFIKYAQSDKAFSDDEHVKAWLITVAANTCKDMLKAAESRAVLTDRIDEEAHPTWSAPDEGDSRADELAEALSQLDEKYRIVLYLKYYERCSAAQIANILGMPENTVYTNLSRGRNQLKEVLEHGKDGRVARRRAV